MKLHYSVDVNFDSEGQVFCGTSHDIPGLTVETESFPELIGVVMDAVPYLLESNLKVTGTSENPITVDINLKKEMSDFEPRIKQFKPSCIFRITLDSNYAA